MKIITRKTKAAEVAACWKAQFCVFESWKAKGWSDVSREETYQKLVALGPNPNPDDVDAVIGNKSWTSVPSCDECGSSPEVVVQVGEEPDYESSTADLCARCARAVVEAFDLHADSNNQARQDP